MKFLDEATIEVHAGHGGSGYRGFRREKFVPFGGPDGGNGGKGGDVILIADPNKHTLLDFSFRPIWQAEDGQAGDGGLRDGKFGADLTIHVPVGTEVFRLDSAEPLIDLSSPDQRFVLARGGRGGKGNAFFKSSTNRAPQQFQPGESGEEGFFKLSLKLVADVGLIGFPNAGKSTLISRISAAKPKIADYPFTTLEPNLGVVKAKSRNFVVADIPGLIPGAHLGKGLGIKFLKHVERTKILAHLIDPNHLNDDGSTLPPLEAFRQINTELQAFSPELANRPQLVVFTKAETYDLKTLLEAQQTLKEEGLDSFVISSVTGLGIDDFVEELARRCTEQC